MNKSEFRYFCRHCRGKLSTPTANPREAFDSKGCHRSFYRHRCLACEREMPRNSESQKICYRAECKQKWAQKTLQSRFLGTDSAFVKDPLKTSTKQGVREPDKYGRRWFVVAGEISPNAATVSDGLDCQWKGGEFERVEAKNRAALKAADEAAIEGQWLLHRSRTGARSCRQMA